MQDAKDRSVLIVEDEGISRRALTTLLNNSGYQTESYASAEDALRGLDNDRLPRIALIDLNLPGMNGLELINRLEEKDDSAFPVLITATEAETIRKIGDEHHVAYMRKPLDFERLLTVLNARQMRH